MLKIYLAASFDRRKEIAKLRDEIQKIPELKVISSWLNESHGLVLSDFRNEQKFTLFARPCIEEIEKSNIFIQFLDNKNFRGGAHVEFGLALSLYLTAKKTCRHLITVGTCERNIFHFSPAVRHFDSPKILLREIQLNLFTKLEREFNGNHKQQTNQHKQQDSLSFSLKRPEV